QQIDPDRAADRDLRVGRVGVELLQTGDELEARDLAVRRRLPLRAGGERGARRARTRGDVDLVQRIEVPLRVSDGPEELLRAAQLQPVFAVRGRGDLRGGGLVRRVRGERGQQQGETDEFSHEP